MTLNADDVRFLNFINGNEFNELGVAKMIPGDFIMMEKGTETHFKCEKAFGRLPPTMEIGAHGRVFMIMSGAGKAWPKQLPVVEIPDELLKMIKRGKSTDGGR